mmetsp:Transcript_8900/g.25848  ORF Transcript_8900/g.25848 Transcript_8900/m.25848 type:complete len:285 (+) Transcript_8900:2052-2906(+)
MVGARGGPHHHGGGAGRVEVELGGRCAGLVEVMAVEAHPAGRLRRAPRRRHGEGHEQVARAAQAEERVLVPGDVGDAGELGAVRPFRRVAPDVEAAEEAVEGGFRGPEVGEEGARGHLAQALPPVPPELLVEHLGPPLLVRVRERTLPLEEVALEPRHVAAVVRRAELEGHHQRAGAQARRLHLAEGIRVRVVARRHEARHGAAVGEGADELLPDEVLGLTRRVDGHHLGQPARDRRHDHGVVAVEPRDRARGEFDDRLAEQHRPQLQGGLGPGEEGTLVGIQR